MRILNFLLCTAFSLGSGTAFAGWRAYFTLFTKEEGNPISVSFQTKSTDSFQDIAAKALENLAPKMVVSEDQTQIIRRISEAMTHYCTSGSLQAEERTSDDGSLCFRTKTQDLEVNGIFQNTVTERKIIFQVKDEEGQSDIVAFTSACLFNEE
ncbi:MAG: hypothetical protein BGO07_02315 [Alphaproteobacteria bacterium 40-19]|nr:MAG: hypothetical protein BGO07_02315 [Alphaproteobacteria bacterium 40-19]